jgi:hypothetical protein
MTASMASTPLGRLGEMFQSRVGAAERQLRPVLGPESDRGTSSAATYATATNGSRIVDGPDPRFRLTPLGAGTYGLSRHDRNNCEPLPYEGTLDEFGRRDECRPGAWAAPWPDLPS